jgi:hypothetical protein
MPLFNMEHTIIYLCIITFDFAFSNQICSISPSNILGNILGVREPESCQSECISLDKCNFFTWIRWECTTRLWGRQIYFTRNASHCKKLMSVTWITWVCNYVVWSQDYATQNASNHQKVVSLTWIRWVHN